MSQIVLGGGCFWCLEAAYQQVRGVDSVTSGYAGGDGPRPDYQLVSSGRSGYVEVVEIKFDDELISLEQILDVFWIIHDPTSRDRQGADVGSQYRSVIFYHDEEQKAAVLQSIDKVQPLWSQPIVTEVHALGKFYPAEPEHQNYFARNPWQGYCLAVINPKLAKLRAELSPLLKTA